MANFANAYTSMSGIDLTAVFGNTVVGTLQGISYSITREKAPVYTFGSANPRSFSRGKRGIAGSCVFTLFDRAAMKQVMENTSSNYYAHAHEAQSSFDPKVAQNVFDQYAGINASATPTITTTAREAEYADQIMPFDVTLVAQNEYGLSAFMVIIGLEILNEGGGLSVDDITNEEQMTYVARGKSPWIASSTLDPVTGAATPGVTTFTQTAAADRQFFQPDGWTVNELTGEIERPVTP